MNAAFTPPAPPCTHSSFAPVRTAAHPLSTQCDTQRATYVTQPRHASFVRRRPPITAARRPVQRATTTTSVWVEHAANVDIEGMTPTDCFDCYSDLEAMPKWSPWLKSVQVDRVNPDISRWTLSAQGMEVSWKARNTKVKRGEIIAWVSETGLKNRGRVTFEQVQNNGCRVTLAIEFDIPAAVARAVDNDYIGKFVVSTLSADLKRFRKVALHYRRKSIIDAKLQPE